MSSAFFEAAQAQQSAVTKLEHKLYYSEDGSIIDIFI
jgi:hypothetical protein